MSTIDLSRVTADDLYDAHVSELHDRVSATKPTVAKPDRMSKVAIARMALCLAAGVPGAGSLVVLGSADWQGEDAPDLSDFPDTMPSRVSLSDDGLGLVETHGAFKICWRECKVPECRAGFVQRRGSRARARWQEVCSPECRKTWKNHRQRITRAA